MLRCRVTTWVCGVSHLLLKCGVQNEDSTKLLTSECLSHYYSSFIVHPQSAHFLLNCHVSPFRCCLWTLGPTAMFGKEVTVNSCLQASTPPGESWRTRVTRCLRTPPVVTTSRDDAMRQCGCPSWNTTRPAPTRRPTNRGQSATRGSGFGTAVWPLAAAHRDSRWANMNGNYGRGVRQLNNGSGVWKWIMICSVCGN